jgi:hypothetical protein
MPVHNRSQTTRSCSSLLVGIVMFHRFGTRRRMGNQRRSCEEQCHKYEVRYIEYPLVGQGQGSRIDVANVIVANNSNQSTPVLFCHPLESSAVWFARLAPCVRTRSHDGYSRTVNLADTT